MNHTFTHLPGPYPFGKPESTLHVLSMYSNPARYHVRPRLFHEFKERIEKTPNASLWIVEVAFGERPFEVTEAGNPRHLQLRTHDELWHKENALNLLAQRLPPDWKYCAWLDSDIAFDSKPDSWAQEALHHLQHHHIIQMWEKCLDLDIQGNVMHVHRSMVSSWKSGLPYTRQYGGFHPGYGWGYTRAAWDGIGGLLDIGILGAGDDHMGKALIGRPASDSVPTGMHPHYRMMVEAWSKHAMDVVKLDLGYLPLTLKHFYHGSKVNRQYWSRWSVLRGCEKNDCRGDHCPEKHHHRPVFDPVMDLKRDWQGLYQLTDGKLHIRDGIRKYFVQRNEDANV